MALTAADAFAKSMIDKTSSVISVAHEWWQRNQRVFEDDDSRFAIGWDEFPNAELRGDGPASAGTASNEHPGYAVQRRKGKKWQ